MSDAAFDPPPFEQLTDDREPVVGGPFQAVDTGPAATGKVTYRQFMDTDAQRQAIFDRVRRAYEGKVMEHDGYRLEFADVDYHKPKKFTRRDEKNAVLGRKRLYWPLRGRMRMIGPDGKVVSEDKKPRTLTHVPYLSQRGTFIHQGSEYVLGNQQRLRPGIYTRVQNNGEVESQFNIIPGTGRGFRVKMDPESGVFRMQVGQSNMKLFPILKDMGFTDKQLEEAWGKELYQRNALEDDKNERQTLSKLVSKLGGPKDAALEPGQAKARLREIFDRMRLDADVTKRTMGKAYERVDNETLLAATQRLLGVNRGEQQGDERDDLPFQSFHSAEDFFGEHVDKDAKRLINAAYWKARNRGTEAVPDNFFTPQLQSVLLESGLAAPLQEINPVEILDARHKINRLGEGGITSTQAVSRDARGVQPTHFGFIDPIRAPECYDDQTEVMTSDGWVRWSDVTEDTKFACLIDECHLDYCKAEALHVSHYKGEMHVGRSRFIEYCVTPNHRMYVRPQSGTLRDGSLYDPVYRIESPATVATKKRLFRTGEHQPLPFTSSCFELPTVDGGNATKNVTEPLNIYAWCAFLGWYLSEGSLVAAGGCYNARISQVAEANPEEYEEIAEILSQLPFSWSSDPRGFSVGAKQLVSYLAQFGLCHQKWIPPEVFAAPIGARKAFVHALLGGDGRKNRYGVRSALCTTSKRLADDLNRLLFEMGEASRVTFEPDDREERYHGCWIVHIHAHPERLLVHKSPRHPDGQYKTVEYDGLVYCATVPGGLLYVRRNNSCGFWCGNSGKIGLDLRLASGVVRGSDGKLYTKARNPKTGAEEYVSASKFVDSVVAFPGEMARDQAKVRAMVGSKIRYVPKSKVDYELSEGGNLFTPGSNFVPLASALKGQRLLMGARMQSQALPLEQAEAPLVQTRAPGSEQSMNRLYAKDMGAVFGDVGGTVKKITPDSIIVQGDDGQLHEHELYDNHPFNQKCVEAHTRLLVRRADGSYFTGEIAYYRFREGDKTLSVDKKSGVVHWRPVEAVQRFENDKTMLRVRLASGRELRVTEDHSLVRLTSDGLAKVEPGALVVGKDYLPSPRNFSVGSEGAAPLPGFAAAFRHLEFGQLIGIYLAEGSRANDTCHAIACFEEEGARQILRLVSLLGLSGRWDGRSVYVPTHPELAAWIDEFVGHGASNKHLHRSTVAFGAEFARGVIGGFFSGDGWAARDQNGALQVEAGTRSLELREDLEFCAQGAGLLTTKREAVVEGNLFYYLRVRTESANRVPWLLRRKQDACTGGSLSSRSFDVVPLPRERRKSFYRHAGSSPRIHHMGASGRVPTCEIAGDPWLQAWSADLYWDRVVAVEEVESPEFVYDLSAGNGVFWADGVFIHNTTIHNTPVVKRGDRIEAGQLLAKSNFTDDTGQLALGRNMRVAFHMMDGMTHEDAVVLSESAAKKYSSEQLYTHTLERGDTIDQISKKQFVSKYPGRFDKSQMENIDDNGVIKPGTKVNPGDPLILAVGGKKKKIKGSIMRSSKSNFTDSSETWDHEHAGMVTDVYKTGKGWRVSVKTYTPAHVGDKLANNYGGKGVITRVVPDSQMPTGADGRPIELALNPMGVISRTNPSQIIESALGKVAAKTGKPYILPSFDDRHMAEFAMNELQKHGLSDTEDLVDPRTGRKIPDVFTGVQHFYKLHHLSESKMNARNQAAYTMDDTPAKGGKDGAKRIGLMETFGLLSHGATEVLKDSKLVRGQRNDDYWQLYRLGMNPPAPRVSRQYQKFEALLQGAGVNLIKKGSKTQILPMSDADIDALAADREITSGDTVNFDTGEPKPGGLFDVAKTGGADGTKWSYISLPEAMPNPVMEEPIKAMLGLTGPQFEGIMAGTKDLEGKTGGQAIQAALEKMNVDREIEQAKEMIREGKKTKRDKAVKRLGYLTTLKKNEIKPGELMLSKVPVVPPKWRPVSRMEGVELVADANHLYKEVLEAKDNYQRSKKVFGSPGDTRLDLYNAFKGATGMGNPITVENQQRNVRGMLKQVFGTSPKFGFYQRSVISQPVDNVGRAVIVPDPDYDIDEVGLPIEAAWEMFKPFTIRDLTRRGKSAKDAIKAWTDRDPQAKDALLRVMKERPLIINRAPSLHKHNLTAHYAKPVAGNALRLPIPILSGHGADFDGDALNFHVPVSDKAVEEARTKMMPSQNLYSAKDFQVHMTPDQGYVMGLYLGTKGDSGRQRRTFKTKQDVIKAYKRGEIDANDPVTVLNAR